MLFGHGINICLCGVEQLGGLTFEKYTFVLLLSRGAGLVHKLCAYSLTMCLLLLHELFACLCSCLLLVWDNALAGPFSKLLLLLVLRVTLACSQKSMNDLRIAS